MAAAIPWIIPQYLDNNGKPLAGGKVWTYQAGTQIPAASFTDSFGNVPNTNPVILDGAGRASIWLVPGSYKVVLMDKNDNVIWTKDNIKPNDGGGGGIIDSDYTFDAWSARFNEQFTSTGLMDTLTKIIKPQYTPPTINLSGSSNILREKGDVVNSITLTANIVRRSNPIDQVRFYQGMTLINTKTGTIPNGGTETSPYSTPFSDNISFRAEVDDTQVGDDGPTTVGSNTITYQFVYPYFWGTAANSTQTAAQVAAMTKDVRASSASVERTFSASAGNYFYFAQPASYPAITKIFDANNFEVQGNFRSFVGDYVALDGSTQSLRVYVNVAPIGVDTYLRYVR